MSQSPAQRRSLTPTPGALSPAGHGLGAATPLMMSSTSKRSESISLSRGATPVPKPLTVEEKRHLDLKASVRREFEAIDAVSEATTSVYQLLPKLTTKQASESIRFHTSKSKTPMRKRTAGGRTPSPVKFADLSSPGTTRSPSPPSRAATSMSDRTTHTGSPTPSVSIHNPTVNVLYPKRERTKFERDSEKRQAGLAVLTMLDQQGKEMVSGATYGEKHKKAAERRFHLLQDEALAKLVTFYEHEDARVLALTSNAQREQEERAKLWLKVMAGQVRAALMMQMVREFRAKNVLSSLFKLRFVSHMQRRKARIRRRQALQERQEQMTQRPTKQQLRKVPCMRSLGDSSLNQLIDLLEKVCFISGEYVAVEGTAGTGCYFLYRGAVELIRKERNPSTAKSTHRSTDSQRETNADGVEGLPSGGGGGGSQLRKEEGCAIGDNHLLTEESYEYTVQAVQDTDMWFLDRKVFLEFVDQLPANQAEPVHRMLDERRERNMVANKSLSEGFIRRSSAFFASWTDAGVKRLVELAMPSIYRKGDTIVSAGHFGRMILFIVKGKVLVSDGKRSEVVREGQAIGEVTAARNVKDRLTEVKALVGCDCWVLQRTDFGELLCHENPMAFLPSLMLMFEEQNREKARH